MTQNKLPIISSLIICFLLQSVFCLSLDTSELNLTRLLCSCDKWVIEDETQWLSKFTGEMMFEIETTLSHTFSTHMSIHIIQTLISNILGKQLDSLPFRVYLMSFLFILNLIYLAPSFPAPMLANVIVYKSPLFSNSTAVPCTDLRKCLENVRSGKSDLRFRCDNHNL